MTLNEIFQTLKSLSKADLNSVKEYLESLELNFNGFEDFLLTKKSEKLSSICFKTAGKSEYIQSNGLEKLLIPVIRIPLATPQNHPKEIA